VYGKINIEMTWMMVVRITIKVMIESGRKRRGREQKDEKRGTYMLITTVVIA